MSSDELCSECNQNSYESRWTNHVIRNISKMILIIGQVKVDLEQYIMLGGLMGVIIEWDIENQQWKRYRNHKDQDEYKYEDVEDEDEDEEDDDDEVGVEATLKKLDNFVNFNDVLNEMAIRFKIYTGNLREYLKINFNNINWSQKLYNLWYLSEVMMNIHKLDIVHHDFHPANRVNSNNPEKKNIVAVLPYIAPEVLSGDEEYTKAANVYSFGIIAYEMITGFPPYPNIPHYKDLAMKICNGLRSKIPFHTPKLIARTNYEVLGCSNYTNQESTTVTPLNYKHIREQFIPVDFFNYSNLPKPKNQENFERELEELTESISHIITS
ncbi:hypothetical protein Glove_60g158 [Diversispora epigaea]|uniref:Protein kinase domain-containing protein n=1 Tax=Diversispora epigaea TaxID=1348612 RepID=A0A397JG92_9GLOM|nr:hypothetical protein Glove_60g158 [Diversispora epigaea]